MVFGCGRDGETKKQNGKKWKKLKKEISGRKLEKEHPPASRAGREGSNRADRKRNNRVERLRSTEGG